MIELLLEVLVVAFKANNVCSLQDHSLEALGKYSECFYQIGFDQTYALGDLIFKTYLSTSKDVGFASTPDGEAVKKAIDLEGGEAESVGSICESILSYAISFNYCLLENPAIWGDIPDNEEEEQPKDGVTPAQFVESTIFTAERVKTLLTTLTMKYLMLTSDEISAWQEDSLAYFMDVKSESNVTKGNFLREKANRLVAGIQLRYEPLFNEFCMVEIVQNKLDNPSSGF